MGEKLPVVSPFGRGVVGANGLACITAKEPAAQGYPILLRQYPPGLGNVGQAPLGVHYIGPDNGTGGAGFHAAAALPAGPGSGDQEVEVVVNRVPRNQEPKCR